MSRVVLRRIFVDIDVVFTVRTRSAFAKWKFPNGLGQNFVLILRESPPFDSAKTRLINTHM